MGTIRTSSGTKIAICSTATSSSVRATLAALTYIDIGYVESLGEIGPQSQDVTFTNINGDPVQHLKGAVDNGAITLVVGKDPLDAGQIAILAAAATKLEYALRITEADAADGNDTNSITYVRGPVMGGRKTIGGANDVTKRSFMVGLNYYSELESVAVP